MTTAMTDENSSGGSDTTHTSIEIDREVWRQVRAEAVAEGSNVSVKLEDILRQHFDMDESDT
jgi:hypothetical protein